MKRHKVFVLFFLILTMAGCGSRFSAKELKFSGTVELTEHSLGAKQAGRVTAVLVDEGDLVKQGQLLATLDRFEQTKKDFERLKGLVEQGGATQQELEYAALALEDQQIIAPIDGIILLKVHEAGEAVSAGSAVVVVGDRSYFWVRIFVPEGFINRIQTNQPAVLHFDGIKQSFNGHVSFISPQAEFTPRNVQTTEERVTQTFAVKITLDNPPEFLRPGVAADIVIQNQR